MRAQTSQLTVSPHDGYIIFQDDEAFVRMTSAMWEWKTVGEEQLAAPRHALGWLLAASASLFDAQSGGSLPAASLDGLLQPSGKRLSADACETVARELGQQWTRYEDEGVSPPPDFFQHG